ncbi:MAG: alkyl hydroperoxide reductase [Actinobacteria bacterium HGW-Actinobacteria-4]|nr:MAG: alkyl hydroperoxide reductase [Actinobacteria bacterium HGW-Actinobacteria-4]
MKRFFTRGFVELAGTVGLVATASSIAQAVRTDQWLWLAAAAPWLGLIGYLAYSKLGNPVRTSRHQWGLHALSAAGITASAMAGPVALGLAALGAAVTVFYTHGYSRQHTPDAMVTVGARLPEFPLTALDGQVVSSEVLTHEPHVIMFYRGNWCPFCMAQVGQLVEQYHELERRGVKVAMISPQRQEDTEELSHRFNVPMEFYADVDGAAASMLDILQAGGTPLLYGAGTNGDTVVPTVIITDGTGTVVWVHHADNHRIRPEPSVFLEVIDREGIAVPR